MQKLEIKRFGPVKDIEIDINDYLVFIGPQASGKSTISKTIFFFKSLRDDLIRYVLDSIDKEKRGKSVLGELFIEPSFEPISAFSLIIKRRFFQFFGHTLSLDDIYISYNYKNNIWIKLTQDEKERRFVNPECSPEFKKTLLKIVDEAKKFLKYKNPIDQKFLSSKDLIRTESEKVFIMNHIEAITNNLFDEDKDLFFIPAGRSLLATLSDQLQNIKSYSLDYIMQSFIDRINSTKHLFNKSIEDIIIERKELTLEKIDFEKVNIAAKLIKEVLKGEYRFDKEGEKIYLNENQYTKISLSSSGQQEAVWILLMVFLFILENRDVFVVIEEPEAHLYPEAQKTIIDMITLLGNIKNNQIIITTHSPYILSSINNLIYANKVGKNNREKVKKRIHQNLWLDADKVGAYFIDQGKIRDILDMEIESIETEAIDSASTIINDDYEYLFEIE